MWTIGIAVFIEIISYLIGFHMMIDSWRAGRNQKGWRMAQSLWEQTKKEDEDWSRTPVEDEDIPLFVVAVPRFKDDVEALQRLLTPDKPPLKRARRKWSARVF
jgi:hypothetical protein